VTEAKVFEILEMPSSQKPSAEFLKLKSFWTFWLDSDLTDLCSWTILETAWNDDSIAIRLR
jgi:hypothetical protein